MSDTPNIDDCPRVKAHIESRAGLWEVKPEFAMQLEREIAELALWKREAELMHEYWDKVDDAVRNHPAARIGASVAGEALRLIMEHARIARIFIASDSAEPGKAPAR